SHPRICDIVFSSDGYYVASASFAGNDIRIWNIVDITKVHEAKRVQEYSEPLFFTGDNSQLIVGCMGNGMGYKRIVNESGCVNNFKKGEMSTLVAVNMRFFKDGPT